MSHAYPIAKTARAALNKAKAAARSRAEAAAIAAPETIAALETEWLVIQQEEVSNLMEKAERGPGQGFLQTYEDASGNHVLAVTYWKVKSKAAKTLKPVNTSPKEEDHTDDLYFRHRSSKRRKKTAVNPNQLNLFGSAKDD